MARRRVLIGVSARHMLTAPLLQSVRAISASLGPHGRSLLYEPTPGTVALASDGLTIAMEMAESEGERSIGPRILKETLFAASRELGDGSARIACMLGAILREGTRLVAAGYPPQQLADEISAIGRLVGKRLDRQSIPAPARRAMAGTLTGNAAIANAAAAAVGHSRADGVVDVKEHPRDGVKIESGDGFILDAVLPSERLGPMPPATALELNHVFVLVANEVISDFGSLWPILEGFAAKKKSLAIVARDVTGSALEALVRNHRELGLHVAALKPLDVSSGASEVLEDLAIATGATLVDANLGRALDGMRPSMLGRTKRLSFAKGRALFADPAGDRKAVDQRRKELSRDAEKARYLAYDRERLLRRSARLIGRWGQISVGGRNTYETSSRLSEARAAVVSLQAALRSGVVAGGGSALAREAWRLRREASGASADGRAARLCVARGLEAVFTQIARNAGIDPDAPLRLVRDSESPATGLDALTGRIGDIVAEGIADPLSITAGTVAFAVSAAATLLRVEAIVCR
jgi:chaperonin GroEL (HSP60 family)